MGGRVRTLFIFYDGLVSYSMMTSWHGYPFCITDPLWGESTSHQWIPLTKGQLHRALMFSSMLVCSPLNKQLTCQWSEMSHVTLVMWCHCNIASVSITDGDPQIFAVSYQFQALQSLLSKSHTNITTGHVFLIAFSMLIITYSTLLH